MDLIGDGHEKREWTGLDTDTRSVNGPDWRLYGPWIPYGPCGPLIGYGPFAFLASDYVFDSFSCPQYSVYLFA